MERTTVTKTSGRAKKGRPALTPEARDNQMISLAYNVAEQQMLDGTASSQVITHFLKLGTMKTKLEIEKIKKETTLLAAKEESLQSTKRIEELFTKAISAFRDYGGHGGDDDYDE